MALIIKDRVWESSTSTGTGVFVLEGSKTGYRTFSSVLADGDTCFYTIVADAGLWETGLATYNSGTNSLTRTVRYDNSSGTTGAINFTAGAKEVFLSLPANSYLDTSGTLAANSDTKVPSQKAVKTYVDTEASKTPFRNRIINGNFSVDTYNGGAETTINVTKYAVNRWKIGITQTNNLKTQRITSGAMPRNTRSYLRVKIASAIASPVSADYFSISQIIEGFHFYDFNFGTADASPVTLSFKVKSSVAGTYSISLGNGTNDRAYVTTYTINSADTWEDKSITIPGDTTGTWDNGTGTGCRINFALGGGSNHTTSTTDTWFSGSYLRTPGSTQLISNLNATFDITNVQLEKGSVATSYEVIDASTNASRCERYYQKVLANTRGYAQAGTQTLETPIVYRTLMRAVPTASLLAGARGNVSSVVAGDVGIYGARHVVQAAAAGDTYAIGEVAVFDAEL